MYTNIITTFMLYFKVKINEKKNCKIVFILKLARREVVSLLCLPVFSLKHIIRNHILEKTSGGF